MNKNDILLSLLVSILATWKLARKVVRTHESVKTSYFDELVKFLYLENFHLYGSDFMLAKKNTILNVRKYIVHELQPGSILKSTILTLIIQTF